MFYRRQTCLHFSISKPPFLRYDNTDYVGSKVKGIRIADARFSIT